MANALQQNFNDFLFMVVIVIGDLGRLPVHIIFHVFYHGIELGFLFVGQDFAHLGVN